MRRSFAILNAKLARPGYRAGTVMRPKLFRTLDRWHERRATAICAPAGYGKSTLVSCWLDCSPVTQPVAWLSLDEGDRDPTQFVYSFASALDTIALGSLALVQPILEDSQGDAMRALTFLVAALEDGTRGPGVDDAQHLLVVLDDLQRAQSPEVAALVQLMLERGPRRLHLMLLARRRGDLPLARLLAHESVFVLTADDLRFNDDEICRFVEANGFPRPTDAELADLAQRSEGWIMALQLAVLAMRHRDQVADLAGALHADNVWLAEFLVEEVLKQQTPAMRRFLLQTSILDQFDASLCAAVTGAQDAYAKLTAVSSSELFLIRLTESGGWHRYHHLFQLLLQQQLLEQTETAELVEMHRRAAAWLARTGDVDAAVRHWLAAGDAAQAAALVEHHLQPALFGELRTAKHLLGLLPVHILEQRPRLTLDRALLAILYGSTEATALVQRADAILDAQQISQERAPELHAYRLLLRACIALFAGDLAAVAATLEEAARSERYYSDPLLGMVCFLRVHLLRYAGRLAEMEVCAERALTAFARAGFDTGVVALQRELASWSMRNGHSWKASQQFAAIFSTPSHGRPTALRELTFAYFYAAENSYWQNRLDEARAYQQSALALATQLQDEELIYYAARLAALYVGAAGEPAGEIAGVRPAPPITSRGLTQMLLDVETLLLVAGSHGQEAEKLLGDARSVLTISTMSHKDRNLLPYLRAYLARGANLAAIAPVLTDALAYRASIGDLFNQLQLLALETWLQLQLKGKRTALRKLRKVVELAQETGYLRVPLEIPALADLLPEVTDASGQVIRRRRTAPVSPTAPELTDQERAVLNLLAADYSYQQIAVELVVSVNTVRTHVRHLYGKLAVHRRERAIEQARRRGLLAEIPAPLPD